MHTSDYLSQVLEVRTSKDNPSGVNIHWSWNHYSTLGAIRGHSMDEASNVIDRRLSESGSILGISLGIVLAFIQEIARHAYATDVYICARGKLVNNKVR